MSKSLDELREIELKWQYGVFTFVPDFEVIKKELKALELIKEKNVDVDFFKYCCQEFSDEVALEQYNVRHIECSNNGKKLTGEEYDFLKEVLL